MSLPTRGFTILVALDEHTTIAPILELASALVPLPPPGGDAATLTGRVVLLRVVQVPADLAFSTGTAPAQQLRQSLGRLGRLRFPPHIELRTTVRVSRERWEGVVEAARQESANLILVPWQEWVQEHAQVPRTLGEGVDRLVRSARCDVAIVRPTSLAGIKNVLVPVRGGPHAALAVQLAASLAERAGAGVTLLHVDRTDLPPAARERERAEFEAVLAVAPAEARARVTATTVEAPAAALRSALVDRARAHQLLVMGAAAGSPDTPLALGPLAEAMVRAVEGGVVVVRTRLAGTVTHEEWAPVYGPPAAPLPRASRLSTVVDKWFAENTFDSSEFDRLDQLVRLKRQQGLTISVGLPALNEEETVGPIIRSIKAELCERYPLLDELVLVDSSSTDRTREIATRLGIRVVIHQEVLPEEGAVAGKGEALWKSLHALHGDIVAWIDTDIRNIHPRFVYGLLGPLLKEPRIQYVKGFYKRPIKAGPRVQSTGGGRVTELMARPLINSFYPELSGLIQPLAGEYAGRRSALEQVPFFSGYGVEIGMLIDLLERFGLEAIGQVDLKRRVHRNQSLPSLSRMAFTILQVVMKRLESGGTLAFDAEELATSMKLIHHDREGFHVEERSLSDLERPPMATVPGYRAARGYSS